MVSQEMINDVDLTSVPYVQVRTRVIEPVRESILQIGFLLLLAISVVGGVFLAINQYTGTQYHEMQKLRQENVLLERANETTRLEVARLESLARIQYVAETELGMQVPETVLYGKRDYVVDQSKIRD